MMFDGLISLWRSDAEFEFPPEELRCHRILMARRFQNYVFRTHTGLEHTEKPSFAYGAKDGDSIIHVFLQRAGES